MLLYSIITWIAYSGCTKHIQNLYNVGMEMDMVKNSGNWELRTKLHNFWIPKCKSLESYYRRFLSEFWILRWLEGKKVVKNGNFFYRSSSLNKDHDHTTKNDLSKPNIPGCMGKILPDVCLKNYVCWTSFFCSYKLNIYKSVWRL